MYGDNGSPCLIPLEGSKGSSIPPFTKMEILVDEMQLIITRVSLGGK